MTAQGPRVLDLRGEAPGPDAVAPAVRHLEEGGVLAYPTETVYGFGGPCTPAGVEAVAALKSRDPDKPFLVLAPSLESLESLVWPGYARELAEVFWPGSVTLVLPDPDGTFPPGVRSAAGTVAVRVSPHPWVRALMEAGSGPLTSTSANVPGRPPAVNGAEAAEAARALGAGPEVLVLEAGTLPPSEPSTLVDCTGAVPRVLREGSVPLNRLRCAVPETAGGES